MWNPRFERKRWHTSSMVSSGSITKIRMFMETFVFQSCPVKRTSKGLDPHDWNTCVQVLPQHACNPRFGDAPHLHPEMLRRRKWEHGYDSDFHSTSYSFDHLHQLSPEALSAIASRNLYRANHIWLDFRLNGHLIKVVSREPGDARLER